MSEVVEYVKNRLQGDYWGLSEQSKQLYKQKYETIMETLFID